MADLRAFGRAERAALHGEVLRVHADLASVDLAEAGDDGRTGLAAVDVAAGEAADLLEGAGVEQQVQTLAGGVLALGVLTRAGVLLGVTGELGRTHDGRADRLLVRGAAVLHGLDDGGGCHDIGHLASPSSCSGLDAPLMSSVTSVSPASTPAAGPTKILVTVPATGEYT